MRLFKTALLLCLFVLSGCVAVIESNEMMKRTQALLNTDFQGTTIKDLEYAEGKYHHYDLYLPVDKTNTRSQKLILFVHGGGWTSGSKEDGENWCRYFAHQGYTTAALDYSLQTKGQTPSIDDMVEEMHLCIEAIVAKTAEEGITLDEMALNGFSAGGCLALLFAYRETPELPLKFVIEQSAPTTFDPKEWEEGVHWFVTHTTGVNGSAEGAAAFITKMSGQTVTASMIEDGSARSIYEAISPVCHINYASPPTLCGYGLTDGVVPPSHRQLLHDRLVEYSVPFDYFEFPHSGHALAYDMDVQEAFLEQADEYCQRYFTLR